MINICVKQSFVLHLSLPRFATAIVHGYIISDLVLAMSHEMKKSQKYNYFCLKGKLNNCQIEELDLPEITHL